MSRFSRLFAILLLISSFSLSAFSWQDFLSYFPDELPQLHEVDGNEDYAAFQESFGPEWESEIVKNAASTVGSKARVFFMFAKSLHSSATAMLEQLHAHHADDYGSDGDSAENAKGDA